MISISKKDWSEKKVNQRLKEKLNVIGTLKYNYFNNKKTYQLIILDLIL